MSLIIKDSFMLFVLLILLNLSSCKNMINEDVYPLDFYTQYRQFYLTDGADEFPDSDLWTEQTYHERMAVNKGFLAVGTECYGPVKGQLEIKNDGSNIENLEEYDHVVEGKIDIEKGVLQVQDCPTSSVVQEVELPSGLYSVRVYSKGLTTVEGDEGDDFYRIVIWPATNNDKKVKVLKQYTP
ncbi:MULTISPECIES: hypothetical protein [Sphingobacterium]|uniref:hypothetical protein n=1 Tax=Sphingobacterium TaxID=28453 RepID=UPI00257BFFD8|nr:MULTISPECIES: hypothetical protein [Sphingobacterium]